MQAVILAGGLGTRLGPLTKAIPKPMISVAGKPYLEHQLLSLRAQSITEIVLLTGYLGDQIENYFSDGHHIGLHIRYSREWEPRGTGGALKLAAPLLASTFLLIYGDSYLPIYYRHILRFLERSDAEGLMVVYDNGNHSSPVRNNVQLHPNGRVARYEKDSADELDYVEAGVLTFRRSVIDRIPDGVASLEKEVYPQLIAQGAMLSFVTDEYFYDIGTPERLAHIESFLTNPKFRHAGPGSSLRYLRKYT